MTSGKRNFPLLKWLAWTLATWGALAGSVCLLWSGPDLAHALWLWGLIFALPPLAACCGWRAVLAGARSARWLRVIFWTGTLPGAALTLVLMQGLGEKLQTPSQQQLLLFASALPALALALIFARETLAGNLKTAGFGWALDILGGTACVALLAVSSYFVWEKTCLDPLRRKAGARWAEVGSPMDGFEKNVQPVAENESLRELMHDLSPLGVSTFYKTGSGDGRITAGNALNVPAEIIDGIGQDPGDSVKVSAKAGAILDANKEAFDRIYSGLLRRDPPVWEINITDASSHSTLVPNYLATRMLAQWIIVDGYHRLQQGDEKGAEQAAQAGSRMIRDLRQQPILVSNMIYTAVEALFADLQARLPEDPGAIGQLAADVNAERLQFRKTLQAEAWAVSHFIDNPQPQADDMKAFLAADQPWPKWLRKPLLPLYCHTILRREIYKAWLVEADLVKICDRAPALPDFGEQEMTAACDRAQSLFTPNVLRAWLRLNTALVLREQAEMIRIARAQMEAGKSGDLGTHDSVVIPGVKWLLRGDASANTLTVKLTPIPQWLAENPVAGYHFWLLPLDGSEPWPLRPPQKVSLAH